MRRVCCVVNCSNVSCNDKNNRRQLFKFPSDEKARNKWLEAVGHNLTKGRSQRKYLFICDEHFEESCLFRESIPVLMDGCEVLLPRKHITLRKDSVPTIFKVNAANPTDESTSTDQPNTISDINSSDVALNETISAKSCKVSVKAELSPSSARRVNIVNHIMSLQLSTPVSQPVILPDINYLKAALISDWNLRDIDKFPKFWGMTDTDEGVFFGYMGDLSCEVTRSILVREDMTIEVRAHNKIAKFPALEKVTCLEDLRLAMITIVCLNLCEKAAQGQCENGFFIPKVSSKSTKCKECQLKTNKETKNVKRAAKRLLAKKDKQKKNIKNLKQKYSRSVKRIETMQQHIKDLMGRCSLVKEPSLDYKLKSITVQKRPVKSKPVQKPEVIHIDHSYWKVSEKKGTSSTKHKTAGES